MNTIRRTDNPLFSDYILIQGERAVVAAGGAV